MNNFDDDQLLTIARAIIAFTSHYLSPIKLFFTILSGFLIISCSDIKKSSVTSNLLSNNIIPEIEKWSHNKSTSLNISRNLNRYSQGTICLIRESSYIKRSLKRNNLVVNDVFSNFGDYVGEYKTALVIVDRGNAYASVFSDKSINFSMKNWTPCVPVYRAGFIKIKISRLSNNIIELAAIGGK